MFEKNTFKIIIKINKMGNFFSGKILIQICIYIFMVMLLAAACQKINGSYAALKLCSNLWLKLDWGDKYNNLFGRQIS